MSWSEQERIEAQAPVYPKNAVRIITETGLRVYRELTPMRKDQSRSRKRGRLDPGLENRERHRGGTAHRTGGEGL